MRRNSLLTTQSALQPGSAAPSDTRLKHQFSCFIIGSGTLLIHCAETLLKQGHQLAGVISAEPLVSNWAAKISVPLYETVEVLERHRFDYLFSIVNEQILPGAVLALARKCAINYHDALLPKYAGSHATSWALLNREDTHGITWHVMSEKVDGGDILKQRRVPIVSDDTAFTLNMKCYDAAARAFVELVDDLGHDAVVPHRQAPAERTFYAKHKRPRAGCTIKLCDMAEEIDALTRALDFGPYANPLGLPKLAFDDRFVIIPQVELLDASSNEPPGIVLAITPDCMRLSTASRDIVLRNVLTIDGEALPIRELIIGFNLRLGFRIPNLTIAAEQRLAMLTRLCCEHEPFWVGRLQTFLTPLSAPTVGERLSAARADIKHIRTEMVIPAEFMSFVADSVGTSEIQHALLAAFAAFLARLGDTCEFDIGFSHGPLRDDLHELAGVFATHVPLRITLNCEQNFTSALAAVREQVTEIIRHRTYARDVAARYPALRSRAGNVTSRLAELVVECVQSLAAYEPWTASRLSYVIPQQGEQCLWVYDAARLDADVVARISGWFISFLRSLALNPQQSLAELPLPDNDERHRFLADWNNISIVDTQPPAARALFAAQQVVAIAQDNKPGADNSFVPPRDVLEQQIALIWEKALRRRPIGVFDRFFELGGNSLLAAQVFSEIEELVGQVLPLALLIEYPNIDRLTHLLRSKGWTPGWSSLIAMQPDGDGPSLYCIHGYGGNILSYRQLAAALGPALRIYGLQAQGLDGKRAPYTCIEDIAAHYVAEIINFQPEGPFALAGSSFGGWVAFEMARQLRARGRTVSLLALLDASARELSALPQNSQLKYRLADFARRWDDHVRHLLALSPREKYLYLRRRGVAAWARLKMRLQSRLHHTASHLRPQLQSDEADLLRAIRAVNDSCRRAAAAYVPQAYNGRVVLFQAAEQSRLAEAPFKAFWEQLSARGVELRRVPGNHSTMLQEPLVRWLAEEIKGCFG